MNRKTRRILDWTGSLAALAGIVYICIRLSEYSERIDFARLDELRWAGVLVAALVYGAANVLLARAWWNLTVHFGAATSPACAVRIYGLTQPAKYVPGNLLHLAGRQAKGLANGLPGWSLAKASFWELGMIFCAGLFFFIPVLPLYFPVISGAASISGFLAVIALTGFALARFSGSAVARAFGLQVGFLLVSGLLFAGLLVLTGNPDSFVLPNMPLICGAFILAWVVGLATPGAPAGIGVRELILLFLLRDFMPEADVLLAILLSRIVTVVGDFLFFVWAVLFPDRDSCKNSKL